MSSASSDLKRVAHRIKDLSESDADDRYIQFATDVLGVTLTAQQRDLLRALAQHKRTVIMSGNGPGKSYGVALGKLAFLVLNAGSTVLGTSGSYSQYVDAVWRPLKQHYKSRIMPLDPGFDDPNDSGQPSLELADDWFAKVISPRDPGDLEGRHDANVLVVIEEADKAYITDDHFDSARSSVTDGNDRMLAVCNPPRDESNPVYDRLQSDGWHTIQFSTLNSHNVRVDAGELDDAKLPGVTDLSTVKDDWREWHGEPWPGLETARAISDPDSADFRENLDERWYRRRAGVMPPSRANAWRPITAGAVRAAADRAHPDADPEAPMGTGVDVARSGADGTVAVTVTGDRAAVRYSQPGADHTRQRDDLQAEYQPAPQHPIAVDAIGEGSGLADMLGEVFDGVIRFGNGNEPMDARTYYSCWEEGLALLGDWLADGGSIRDGDLEEELLLAARMVTFEERHYASRGTEVAKATATKDDIKGRLGRSPDRLDAALMALWAREHGPASGAATVSLGGGGPEHRSGADIDAAVAEQLRERENKWK